MIAAAHPGAPNVGAYIELAYADARLEARAQELWAIHAPSLFLPHDNVLTSSDAGKCVLEVWARLHGRIDVPENHGSRFAKMDGGSMYGLRFACLFAAAFEYEHPGSRVELEMVTEYLGVPGHIDARVFLAPNTEQPYWIIEVKTTFYTGAWDGPRDAHVTQAAIYSSGQGPVGFSIVTIRPGARQRNGTLPRYIEQTDFWFGEEFLIVARVEIARLEAARAEAPPAADATQRWQCEYCRYSRCERNRNPLRQKVSV